MQQPNSNTHCPSSLDTRRNDDNDILLRSFWRSLSCGGPSLLTVRASAMRTLDRHEKKYVKSTDSSRHSILTYFEKCSCAPSFFMARAWRGSRVQPRGDIAPTTLKSYQTEEQIAAPRSQPALLAPASSQFFWGSFVPREGRRCREGPDLPTPHPLF